MDVRLGLRKYWGSILIGVVEGNLGSRHEPDCCLYSEGLVFWVHNNEYLRP